MLYTLGILSAVVSAASSFAYISGIIRHKIRPERMTWFLYSILGGIAFFSQLSEGAVHSLWLIGAISITEIIIFILAIPYGVGGIIKRDLIGLLGAALALILWFFTDNAAIALYLVILIDGIATVLTMIKVYESPRTETFSPWVLTGIAGLLSLSAVGRFSFVLMAYPLYTLVINFVVVGVIALGRRNRSNIV